MVPWKHSYLWLQCWKHIVEKHVQAAPIIPEIYWIEYFKIVFLNIYNCAYKTSFICVCVYVWCVYTCVYMYVCVCVCVCMYTCVYVFLWLRMGVWVCAWHIYAHKYMYVCTAWMLIFVGFNSSWICGSSYPQKSLNFSYIYSYMIRVQMPQKHKPTN